MALTLSLATEHDIALLNDLGGPSYRHHFADVWDSETALEQYLEAEYGLQALHFSLMQENIEWFIIRTTQAIGLVKLSYAQQIPDEAHIGTLINKIYLLPQSTGQGHGQAIFQHIEDLAKQHGDHFIWLEVLASNPAAKSFYQRCGMHLIKNILFVATTQQSQMHILGKNL